MDEVRTKKLVDAVVAGSNTLFEIAATALRNWARPAVDPLFRSAALCYGPAVVGVVLTGDLDDGTAGLLALKERGGVAIVQDPDEAIAPSMPQSALRYVDVDHQSSITAIATLLVSLANDSWEDATRAADATLRLENQIAAGMMTAADWRHLECLATPAGIGCPECGTALYDLNDSRILRLRCRSGHAFSPATALAACVERRERLASAMFGALMEEARLARRLRQRAEFAGDVPRMVAFEERAARCEQLAGSVAHAATARRDEQPRRVTYARSASSPAAAR